MYYLYLGPEDIKKEFYCPCVQNIGEAFYSSKFSSKCVYWAHSKQVYQRHGEEISSGKI